MNRPAAQRRMPISALLRHADQMHGHREVVSRRVEGDLLRCSRAALTARAGRLSNVLATMGIVPGDCIATLAWTGHRHLEVAFAGCGSGAIVHALDPHLHPDRIVHVADDARARIVFFDLSFMPLVEEIAPRLAVTTTFIALTDRANMPAPGTIWDLLCYEDVIANTSDDFDWPDFDDETIASLCNMAGRVAERDGAVSILLPPVGPFAADDLELSSQDIVLSAIPMFHADGWRLACAAWAAGAALVFAGPWLDGRSLHDLVESEGATIVAARPQVWQGLLAHVEREGAGLPSLRRAVVTGDSGRATTTASMQVRPRTTTPLHRWGAGAGRSSVVSG